MNIHQLYSGCTTRLLPLFLSLSLPQNCDLTSSGISSAAATLSMSSLEGAGGGAESSSGRIIEGGVDVCIIRVVVAVIVGAVGNAPRSAAAATAAAAALSNASSQHGDRRVVSLLLRDG